MEKKISLHPRSLARKMAKAHLDRNGATGYNKPQTLLNGKAGPSLFAQHWKSLTLQAMKPQKKKGAKRK